MLFWDLSFYWNELDTKLLTLLNHSHQTFSFQTAQLKLLNLRKLRNLANFSAIFSARLHNFIIDLFFYIRSLKFYFKQLIKYDAVCKCWNFALVEVIHEIDNASELLTSSFCESYENRKLASIKLYFFIIILRIEYLTVFYTQYIALKVT